MLLVVDDVMPIGGGNLISYKYVIAVFDRRNNHPLCFVTLENSSVASNVLCVFENDGRHSNYGRLAGSDLMQEFIEKGLRLIGERFNLDRIEEMAARPERRSWWKFW